MKSDLVSQEVVQGYCSLVRSVLEYAPPVWAGRPAVLPYAVLPAVLPYEKAFVFSGLAPRSSLQIFCAKYNGNIISLHG